MLKTLLAFSSILEVQLLNDDTMLSPIALFLVIYVGGGTAAGIERRNTVLTPPLIL